MPSRGRQLSKRWRAELRRRIVEAVQPDRIVLFGSAAKGTMTPHSDVDVLVVKSGEYRRLEMMHTIRRALRGFPFAVDLVVATPEELETYRDSFALVYFPAVREGEEIYAA
ncbi:MAG TPA: nucleotidyltransferase domain-containing protein [Thermomicrobiales bacterium]|nr:nucleotidyltransferase domain-containing protein [Thermomicrobiales bacterium]